MTEHIYSNQAEMIQAYVKANPDIVSPTKLARIIIEEENLEYSVDSFRKTVGRFMENRIPVHDAGKGERYSVHNGIYRWKSRGQEITLAVDEADELFYEFSRHGLDMTQMSIRNKHDISIRNWHSIKATLWLYKDSDIFSPWTVEHTPKEQLRELIASKMDMKFTDKKRLVEEEYEKVTLKTYNKVIKESTIRDIAIERLVDELYDEMSLEQPVLLTSEFGRDTRDVDAPLDVVVVLADLHIGSMVRDMRLTPDFDSGILRERLNKVARKVNSIGATRVHLAIIGDIIESFTGMNHKNSWQSIEFGMFGAKVVKTAIEMIMDFMGQIENLHQVIGIGGNHDRMTSDNKEDTQSQIADIIFYMIKKLYGGAVPVDYDPLVITREIEGVSYIFTHGDHKVIRDGKSAIIDYGNSKMFNIIFQGHLHTRQTKDDQRSYRWLTCPSVFTGNYYSESNGWQTQPGFLICYNDGDDVPLIIDVPLS
jgi:predicted phosphodiesterase